MLTTWTSEYPDDVLAAAVFGGFWEVVEEVGGGE